jgi:phosphoglycerate dehydrogenase-like enzyme
MEVLAWSMNLDSERAAEAGAEAVAKDELFRRADVVSVHYKLSARSEGIVGAAELAAMKPSAYLVNTSRGPLVDTAALLRALHDGAIAGAALDVYDREPLAPDDPLRTAPRTVLTPHLGYVTRENYRVFFADAVADIEAWLDGRVERRLTAGPGDLA